MRTMNRNMINAMLNMASKNNPMFGRAKQMVEGKTEAQLEETAKNLCRQRGIDLGKAFEQFRQIMQGKI